jgi:para-nitrobenzyl esterase
MNTPHIKGKIGIGSNELVGKGDSRMAAGVMAINKTNYWKLKIDFPPHLMPTPCDLRTGIGKLAAVALALVAFCVAVPGQWSLAASASTAVCPPGLEFAMTQQGCLQGKADDDIRSFKGIPFAAPPVGALRWKGPGPPPIRAQVLVAQVFGPRCVQPQSLQVSPAPQSEDCLNLNVWTPAKGKSLPVMVFIHGGGNTTGSASDTFGLGSTILYDGYELAKRGQVVVVSIQYRLNILGYFVHPALAAESDSKTSGNYGLMDQIAALRWIKDNIESFGGDPSRVMLFGESGGGTDVCALVASPLAKGLFSAAIMESGGCGGRPKAEMEAWGANLTEKAGCSQSADVISCLRQRNAGDLIKAIDLTAVQPGGKIVVMSGPTVDGYVLPLSPYEMLKAGRHNHLPFVIGVNAEETASPLFRIPQMLSQAEYEATIHRQFHGGLADRILKRYPVKDFASPRAALIAVTTDYQFLCPARQYLRALANSQKEPAYGYVYTQVMNGGPARQLGAAHGLELFYVFQTMNRLGPGYSPTPEDYKLEKAALNYWTNFAATGNPNGSGLPNWPRFNSPNDSYLKFNATPSAAERQGEDRCDFWNTLIPEEALH